LPDYSFVSLAAAADSVATEVDSELRMPLLEESLGLENTLEPVVFASYDITDGVVSPLFPAWLEVRFVRAADELRCF